MSIGQVAELFGIHPDTLRNWEKNGYLIPFRIGKRRDRKYRKEDVEIIIKKFGKKLTLQQLEQFLWQSADILRGKIDSSDYKKYIFGFLFYKRISDIWNEGNNFLFKVPADCNWKGILGISEDIGVKLNEIFKKLAQVNSPKLDKIFDDLDFANKDRFPDETLKKLIDHFSRFDFGSNYISVDLLGDAYEYLIKQFAADAGKKGGEFYTPREVEKVIIGILKPHLNDEILDPTVGSGGFLLEAYNYLHERTGERTILPLKLYGQEINLDTFAIAKINMFLHGLGNSDIRRGDTLANPQFLNSSGGLKKFDIVVANPPYSIKQWDFEQFKNNKFGRIKGYCLPPNKNADFAFVLHIVNSMNDMGRAGIVLPHGVLFRGGNEGKIRKQLIENDLIDAIISLPSKLFYGTNIPAVILIFNRKKDKKVKNKILFIDAEKYFQIGKNQNVLGKDDIERIIKTYDNYTDVENYARVVDLGEVEENQFNLNIRKYISCDKKDESFDIKDVWNELKKLEKEKKEIDKKLSGYFKKLNGLINNEK